MSIIALSAVALLTTSAFDGQQQPQPATPAPTMNTPAPTADSPAAPAPTAGVSETMAREKLLDAGYGRVERITRNARGEWEATAMRGGKPTPVIIAPDGTVVPKSPM